MNPEDRAVEVEDATESQILDAAARQRMLNQRFSKEIYASLLGEKTNYRETLGLLRETAGALEGGGMVRLTDRSAIRVPAAATEVLAATFRRQLELIAEMETIAGKITGGGWTIFRRSATGMTALSELCEEFQKTANRATVLVSERLTAAWEQRRGGDGSR